MSTISFFRILASFPEFTEHISQSSKIGFVSAHEFTDSFMPTTTLGMFGTTLICFLGLKDDRYLCSNSVHVTLGTGL